MKMFFALTAIAVMLGTLWSASDGPAAESFSPYVDGKGNITIPKDFRSWYFLGTWGVATDEEAMPGPQGFHNVYTQPETVSAYRATGKFPDGAVLVKELLKAKTDLMTSGEISYATETEGWFIMVKDTKGRFKDSDLWGDGWGWALINRDDPAKIATADYKAECLPCHQPARKDDWVYLRGYPGLKK